MHVGDQVLSDVEGAKNANIHPVLIDRDKASSSFQECPRIENLNQISGILELY